MKYSKFLKVWINDIISIIHNSFYFHNFVIIKHEDTVIE